MQLKRLRLTFMDQKTEAQDSIHSTIIGTISLFLSMEFLKNCRMQSAGKMGRKHWQAVAPKNV